MDQNSIERLASAVFDNHRRGMPKQGCDCIQCFGYCLIDNDEAIRQGSLAPARRALRDGDELSFA